MKFVLVYAGDVAEQVVRKIMYTLLDISLHGFTIGMILKYTDM